MPRRPRFKHPLRAIRTAIGISQSEFADLIDCSRHTVQAFENGRLRVSRSLEASIFVETGADTKEFFKGKKGKALDSHGQPYSHKFYQSWKKQKEGYDSSAALKDFESLLAEAAGAGKLPAMLIIAQEWFFDCRNE